MLKYIALAVVAFAVMVYAATVPISGAALITMLLAIGVLAWSALELLIGVFDWWFSEDDGGEKNG